MIAWINFAVLLAATVLFLLIYQRSVMPAGWEMITADPKVYHSAAVTCA